MAMTAEDTGLIDGQYADRPALRPILDAILAVLPEVGDATVQPRRTLISLASPKRVFAVVQAATRSRVDLGLRLDGREPAGRLLTARDIGMANLRVALTAPEDVDEEVIGLLRLAYRESVAPNPRKRPAPRPAGPKIPLHVIIEGYDLPGRSTCCPGPDGTGNDNVHVALRSPATGTGTRPGVAIPGGPWLAGDPVPGDAASARWELDITVTETGDGADYTGKYVSGDKSDRNLGLAWGDMPGDGTFRLFRGAKLRLVDVPADVLRTVLSQGSPLLARVRLTDRNGNPICARLRPPDITWSAGTR